MAATAALLRAAAIGGNRMPPVGLVNSNQGRMANQPQQNKMQQQMHLQQQMMFQQWEQQQRHVLLMLLQQQRQQNAQLLHQMAAASTRNAPSTPIAATARAAASQHTGKPSAEAQKDIPASTLTMPSTGVSKVASPAAPTGGEAGEKVHPGSMHEFEAWFNRCCGDDVPVGLMKKLGAVGAGGESDGEESGQELKRSSSMSSASSGSSGSFDDAYFDTLSSSGSSASGDSDGQDVEGCDGAGESDGEQPLPSEEEFEWHLMSVQTSFLNKRGISGSGVGPLVPRKVRVSQQQRLPSVAAFTWSQLHHLLVGLSRPFLLHMVSPRVGFAVSLFWFVCDK
ncbi:unnamed protein product [Closterium sp. NIES-65]|nr:unnamed protein product [Closterium sp. NIES-65]